MAQATESPVDITTIPDAALWAELVRRTQERERSGETSPWPRVTLSMAMGTDVQVEADPTQTVVVSWSGRRHYKLTGGRVLNDGSARAMCSDSTYGREPDADGDVTWGTKKGQPADRLPMCKSCVRSAAGQ